MEVAAVVAAVCLALASFSWCKLIHAYKSAWHTLIEMLTYPTFIFIYAVLVS